MCDRIVVILYIWQKYGRNTHTIHNKPTTETQQKTAYIFLNRRGTGEEQAKNYIKAVRKRREISLEARTKHEKKCF